MLRAVRLAACLAFLAALGCANPPTIRFDPGHDFQRARSWNWRPIDANSRQHSLDLELRERLGSAVERELALRGMPRSATPDLLVNCQLALTRQHVLRTETSATRFVPSLDHTPSYDVESSVQRWVVYERVLLRIVVTDARTGQMVWSGDVQRRVRGRFVSHAERAVEELLASFPPPPALEARLPHAVATR